MRDSRLPVLTVRFVALAAALSIVVAVLPVTSLIGSLLIVNVLLFIATAVDFALATRPANVGIERSIQPVIPMGAEATLHWKVQNPATKSRRISVADAIPPSFRAAKRRFDARVPANGRVISQTTVCPSRRGRFTIATVTVRTIGPLGLAGRIGTRDYPTTVRVYPPFGSRKEAELRIERARVLEVGMRSVRSRGGGTEFEQLREYSVDDDYRHIDWFATARTNKAIVRTYRAEQNQNVMILLDCGRLMAARVDNVTRLEHAIDAVLAVSTVATRLGDRVGLIAFDDRIRVEVNLSQGVSHVTRITEAVYGLHPHLVESDYRRAFVAMMTRARRRCLAILLTEPGDQAIDETLVPALPIVVKNHLLVVAGVQDPDVDRWAHAIPTETDKAYRKAAAVASLLERRRGATRLRASGATVIDAVPGKLASSVADAYLEVKAAGRL